MKVWSIYCKQLNFLHVYMLNCFSHVWLFVTSWTVSPRFPCPWDFPGKDTGMGCMPSSRRSSWSRDQLNPCLLYLLHCRLVLYSLSHQRSRYECTKILLFTLKWLILCDVNLTFKKWGGGQEGWKKEAGSRQKHFTSVIISKKKKRWHHLGPFSLLYARVFVSVLTSFKFCLYFSLKVIFYAFTL